MHACTLSQSDAKGKENIIQSLTHTAQNVVSDQASQETTKLAQVLDNPPLLYSYSTFMHASIHCILLSNSIASNNITWHIIHI